ncbi:unnamed protein product [Rotaria socialis]|nr:unnamed protein product [Rotaria socialis]
MFGDSWTFQQDGGRPHIHRKTQDWCRTHLPCFIGKGHWPPNRNVMVWLGACSKGVSPLVILENGTVDHERYIQEVLPVALKFGNDMFGDSWTFQQDGGRPHIHRKTQDWCRTHLPCFIGKDHWPPNSPDLNPLDYFVWDEFVNAINRDLVTSKTALINELKRSVKNIRSEVVFESYAAWANRLYRLKQANGNCLNK